MPFSEKQHESLGWILHFHWLLVAVLLGVFFDTEGVGFNSGVSPYDLSFSAALLFLVVYLFYFMRRGERFLAPFLFLVDGFLIAAGVAISGGPVSYYLPLVFISLGGTVLSCTPRATWVVVAGHYLFLTAALVFAYHSPWPGLAPSTDTDDMGYYLDRMSGALRDRVFLEQAVRWWVYLGLFLILATVLVRRIWQREEQLRARERALDQKRRLIQMGEMTGRIAHGVNTPLGLLSGNLEMLLADTRKGTKLHKRLMELDGFVQRAITTVRETLDYNRQSLSQIRPVALGDLLATVAESVQGKLKERRGELILDVEKDLPKISGYPEGLFQALLNVVENAVDALPAGKQGVVTVTAVFRFRSMRLSPADRRGDLVVTVNDNGSGIPPGEMDRIFEPFYSTKDFGHGTGLGLSIVKRIVEEHQGVLRVESRVGAGTQVTLSFPTKKPKDPAGPSPTETDA